MTSTSKPTPNQSATNNQPNLLLILIAGLGIAWSANWIRLPSVAPIPIDPSPGVSIDLEALKRATSQVLPNQAIGYSRVFRDCAAKVVDGSIDTEEKMEVFLREGTATARIEAKKEFDIAFEQALSTLNGRIKPDQVEQVRNVLEATASSWK